MAREGLRTLVVGKKVLTEEQYTGFETRLRQARLSVTDREEQVGPWGGPFSIGAISNTMYIQIPVIYTEGRTVYQKIISS